MPPPGIRGPVGVKPIDQYFNQVGKGTILSKKPPKPPKPSRAPQPKKGPYSKPVPYKPGKTYAPNTPVRVGGQTVLTRGTVRTAMQATKPASSKALGRPAPKTLGGQMAAQRAKARYQSMPSLREQVSGLPANTLNLGGLVHRIGGMVLGSGPANDAVIIPGEGGLADQLAEHLTGGVKVGRSASEVLQSFHAPAVVAKVPKNLKLRTNPANFAKGLPVNEGVKAPGGVVSYGKTTFPEWTKRVNAHLSKAEIGQWKGWYKDAKPVFRSLFGKDAEAAMRGFAVSQANTSPAGGLRVVLRVLDDVRHGRPTTNEGIGMVAQTVRQAIEHGYVDKGVAQKLSDFTDNLYGHTTRTWMGHMPEGGYPVAGDVHAARDVGFVDKKLVSRIQAKHPGANPVLDMKGGSPNGTQYEQIQRYYSNLTKHLNRTGFGGHRDWTPEEVQAVGWATIQKHWGATPEIWEPGIVQPNTYRVALETSAGRRTPIGRNFPELSDTHIPLSQGMAITQHIVQSVVPQIVKEEGGLLRNTHFAPGGWQNTITPSAHLDIVGSPEVTQRIVTKLAHVFHQQEVWATRVTHGGKANMSLVLRSPDFADHEKMAAFWRRVQDLATRAQRQHLQGFAPNGPDGMVIGTERKYSPIGGQAALKFRARFESLFEKAAADTGVTIDNYTVTNHERIIGRTKGGASKQARSVTPGGHGLDFHRAEAAAAYERAYATHAPEALAAHRAEGASPSLPAQAAQAALSIGPHLAAAAPLLHGGGKEAAAALGLAALRRGPGGTPTRMLEVGERVLEGPASRAAHYRAATGFWDRMAQEKIFANDPNIGLAESRLASSRVGSMVEAERFYRNERERQLSTELAHLSLGGKTPAERDARRMAVQLVGEEVTPDQWVKNAESIIKSSKDSGQISRLRAGIAKVNAARKYVEEVPTSETHTPTRTNEATTVQLKTTADNRMHHAVDLAMEISGHGGQRPRWAADVGLLDPAQEQFRISAPGRFHRGARAHDLWQPFDPEAKTGSTVRVGGDRVGRFEGFNHDGSARVRFGPAVKTVDPKELELHAGEKLVGQEDFTGGRFYIPSEGIKPRRQFTKAFRKQAAPDELMGTGVAGGTEFRKSYLAKLAAQGFEAHDPARMIGERGLAMQRLHSGLTEMSDLLEHHALPYSAVQKGGKVRGVGERNWFDKMSKAGYRAVKTTSKPLTPGAQHAWAKMTMRDMIPDEREILHLLEASPDEIRFVPQSLIGSIGDHEGAPKIPAIFSAFSKLARLGIVYTKPGHVPPRLISNEVMVAVQQGLKFVPNAIATYGMWRKYPELLGQVDKLVGEHSGYESLIAGKRSPVDLLGHALVRPVAWAADKLPRRQAFMHELAEHVGRSMNVDEMAHYLSGLLADAKANPRGSAGKTLDLLAERSRVAAGEYGRANKFEKSIMPWAFLYQWGKVATKWTAKTAAEHPLLSAGAGYGVYKYGYQGGNNPAQRFAVKLPGGRIVNYTTAAPFTTPFEYGNDLRSALGTLSGLKSPAFGEGLGQAINPAALFLPQAFLGYDPVTGKATGGGPGALKKMGGRTPLGSFLTGKGSWESRAGKFGVGNLYPQAPSAGKDPLAGLPKSVTPSQRKEIERRLKEADQILKAHQKEIDAALKRAGIH